MTAELNWKEYYIASKKGRQLTLDSGIDVGPLIRLYGLEKNPKLISVGPTFIPDYRVKHKFLLFQAIIPHIYENHINFEFSLHFGGSGLLCGVWPKVSEFQKATIKIEVFLFLPCYLGGAVLSRQTGKRLENFNFARSLLKF